jgi:hypothetical protein
MPLVDRIRLELVIGIDCEFFERGCLLGEWRVLIVETAKKRI